MQFENFLKSISQINHLPLCRSGEWLFYPGMLFGSSAKWWADWKTRYTAHEGIDIAFYRTMNGDIGSFNPYIAVPAMADGTILNICDDFLGQSVVIEHGWAGCTAHEMCDHEKSTVAAVYSHICIEKSLTDRYQLPEERLPQNILKAGMAVTKGQIIGRVADTSMKKSGILPHLHISIIEISVNTPFNELNWELFANPDCDSVRFLNPLWL